MEQRDSIRAIRAFIKDVKRTYEAGGATEHSYRPNLIQLFTTLGGAEIRPVNEARRIACGAPDITMMHGDIAIGYLEAKDVGVSLRSHRGQNKTQFDRYTNDLDNLIYTDCLKWDFYLNGVRGRSISVAEVREGKIHPKPDNFEELADYLQDYLGERPKTIKTAEELTEYMAKKTRIIRHAFEKSMQGDEPLEALAQQRDSFDTMLVKDISAEKFADMYAQTITYGMFVARLYSKNPMTFSRQQAQKLLPTSYPFLKDLFKFIASESLDDALDWSIDDLITLYRAADVERIMATYGRGSGREDPFLHFYEDFLKAYNPEEREKAGVYYTPAPVVDFIVRGVDWVLKNKFNLRDGLASQEKTEVTWKTDKVGDSELRKVHKVQILDPATGTGTFLAQTIRHIAKSVKKSFAGNWPSYVDKELLPRLHGFEYMMAPYAMAYLKLDMVLADLDYKPTKAQPDRMSIYLTNSLAEATKDIPSLPFAKWLENEARGASDIKDNFPIMCVIGNPPYSVISQNMGASSTWIKNLIEDYKYVDGVHFRERKHSLQDDYVKFIRMAQHTVDKNGEGVVGMITNHGYLDNPTFAGMRWNLMNSFDEIYVLDLHGDIIKNRTTPDGKTDKNVFDITKGVSIIIAWKTKQTEGAKKPLAQVSRGDLRGARKAKFDALQKESLDSGLFQKLDPRAPDYYFKPVDYKLKTKYDKGFKITEFMCENSVGIVTSRDKLTIDSDKTKLWERVNDFAELGIEEAREKYKLGKDSTTWKIKDAHADIENNLDYSKIVPISYRPFDTRFTYYTGTSGGFICRPMKKIMHHFLENDNLGLLVKRQCKQDFSYAFITDTIIESCMSESAYALTSIFPLYLYPNGVKNLDTNGHSKQVNMDKKIRKAIEDSATDKKHGKPDEYAILDYIYGILHAPEYRTLYLEFLQKDFPHIPYPKNPKEFWDLSEIGTKLRKLHLMKTVTDTDTYTFNGKGESNVYRPRFDKGKVFINKTQYFNNIPERAWNFYIGGYQPAQKWLKDRKGQTLEHADLKHYQRIIAVLVKTYETMDEIVWTR